MIRMIVAAAGVILLVGGCTIQPEPLTAEERARFIVADRARLFRDQEPILGTISLYEAMARTLKYNLDHRVRDLELAISSGNFDLARLDLIPGLLASAGYDERSNTNASSSRSVLTEQESLEPSTSTDRQLFTSDLRFSWNILDFGVSYYQAKQEADRVLIAEELRRRTAHNLMQQVRNAFWRAASAQVASDRIAGVLGQAGAALRTAKRIGNEQLVAPIDALRFQRELLDVMRQMETLRYEFSTAQAELKSLMNMPLTAEIRLEIPERLSTPEFPLDPGEAELVALDNRPELREEQYNKRITAAESKKALLRLLPGIEIGPSFNFNSNSFLVNNIWAELTLRVTGNLVNLLRAPTVLDQSETRQKVSEARRLALSMAIITQVNLAMREYEDMRRRFGRAREIEVVDRRILELTEVSANNEAESQIERVRISATSLTSLLRRFQAYAAAQNALGRLFVSLGLDPLPTDLRSAPVYDMAQQIRANYEAWEQGAIALPAIALDTTQPEPTPQPMPAPPTPGDRPRVPHSQRTPPEPVPAVPPPGYPGTGGREETAPAVTIVRPGEAAAPLPDVQIVRPGDAAAPLPKVTIVRPGDAAAPLPQVQIVRPGDAAAPLPQVQIVRPGDAAAPLPQVQIVRPGDAAAPLPQVQIVRPGDAAAPLPQVQIVRPGDAAAPLPQVQIVRPGDAAAPLPEVQIVRPGDPSAPSFEQRIQHPGLDGTPLPSGTSPSGAAVTPG